VAQDAATDFPIKNRAAIMFMLMSRSKSSGHDRQTCCLVDVGMRVSRAKRGQLTVLSQRPDSRLTLANHPDDALQQLYQPHHSPSHQRHFTRHIHDYYYYIYYTRFEHVKSFTKVKNLKWLNILPITASSWLKMW